jgi:MYXO-CTERM domain-containing protein
MRPVRVTTSGASLSLPMRMASIGTGAVTGITIWVVADGRYEPQNYQFFHIDDSELVWDWSSNISNYSTLRVQRESMLKNAGWEIESSIAVNEQVIKNVIMSGGQYNGNGGLGTTGAPLDATQDYLPVGDADAGAGDGGYESADQVRDDDVKTLFSGLTGPTVRLTRIRSDIAQAAMTTDFVLQAAADQSELSNVRNVTQSVNLTCPIYSGNGCQIIGMGTLAQAQASIDGGASVGGTTIVGQVPQPSGTVSSGSNASAADGGSSGCATAPQGGKSGLAFGALAGLLGLAVGGAIRLRRRRGRSRD